MTSFPITVHMVVKNEDRFIWYAIEAILPYVTKILVTDTGSNDRTIKIIESFKDNRIVFKKIESETPQDITGERQIQLVETKTDWFWIIDGDEVYPKRLIREILQLLQRKSKNIEGIVVGRYDLLGDVYHYQDDSAGYYNLFGRKGHFALRLIHKEKIDGIHVSGQYPLEGYYDEKNIELIHHRPELFAFTVNRLFHATYLERSSKGAILPDVFHRNKFKHEVGIQIPKEEIPEIFYRSEKDHIPDILYERSTLYSLYANIASPLKKIKRSHLITK